MSEQTGTMPWNEAAVAGGEGASATSGDAMLSQVADVLSTQTTVLNALALRLIGLDASVEKLVNRSKNPSPASAPAPVWTGLLPRVRGSDILASGPAIRLIASKGVDGNIIELEQFCLLMHLVHAAKAETIFEFGTFDGRTTVNLAANCPPNGKVFTLDLPGDQMASTRLPLDDRDKAYIKKPLSGVRYRGNPLESKIVQLYGDSAAFDFSPYFGAMDFVFIDASHQYEYVMNDSATALRLLRDGKGIIAWHDYTPWWDGVVRALDQLFITQPKFTAMRHIENTALAYAVIG